MPLKQFTIDFKNIGQQEFLRPNVGYRYFFDIQKAKIYPVKQNIKLKYVLKEISAKKILKGELKDSEVLIDIGNIERRFNNLIGLKEVSEIGSDKNILQEGDIIIPKMQPQMGNIFLNLGHKKYIGSTELLEYIVYENTNPLFLYYLITSKKFLVNLEKLESGKTHRRVNPSDLKKIKIPLILKSKQDKIVVQIEPIEKKIKEMKSKIIPVQEIINKVFAREFGFDLEKFEKLKKEKFFEVGFKNFFNHRDLKFGIGTKKANINLRPFIFKQFEFINLGRIISLEYGSGLTDQQRIEGEYPVMGANGIVGYHNKFLIEGPSIIVGRKGSAGEINYIEKNNYPIDTCFYIKFLQKQNIVYFSYLLKFLQLKRLILFKGVPGLNRYDVYDVKIPNISLKFQQKIVDEIKIELDEQKKINQTIETERNKIDEIIEKAIK